MRELRILGAGTLPVNVWAPSKYFPSRCDRKVTRSTVQALRSGPGGLLQDTRIIFAHVQAVGRIRAFKNPSRPAMPWARYSLGNSLEESVVTFLAPQGTPIARNIFQPTALQSGEIAG